MRRSRWLSTERLILVAGAALLGCGVVVWSVRMSKTPTPPPRPTFDDLLNSGIDVAGAMKAVGSSDQRDIAVALETLAGSLMDHKKCEAVVRTVNLSALDDDGWNAFQVLVRKNWWECRGPLNARLVRELAADHRRGDLDGVLPRLVRVAELGQASEGNRDFKWPTSIPREGVESTIKSLEK